MSIGRSGGRPRAYLETFGRIYLPDDISGDLLQELYTSSTYPTKSLWESADRLLRQSYNFHDRNEYIKQFLPVGIMGVSERFTLRVTHTPRPKSLRNINRRINLALCPWNIGPDIESYIPALYTDESMFLITGANKRRMEMTAIESYQSRCRGWSRDHIYMVDMMASMLSKGVGSSVICRYVPPEHMEPLDRPIRIEVGRIKRRRGKVF